MPTLEVPGADLHYDVAGEGPPLLFIAGGQGSGSVYGAAAEQLRDRFTVVTYDRRGFSGSTLTGPQDYDQRLETDADDVALLIDHLGRGPATVFGSSSGAIVGLTVLSRHPESVATLAAHEPPALRHLPDPDAWIAADEAIYATYRSDGAPAGMKAFMAAWMPHPTSDMRLFATGAAPPPAVVKNNVYWFEHEFRQYPPVRLDLDALRRHADRLVLCMGEEMRENPTTLIAQALSAELGAPLHELPGGHVSYAVMPDRFAEAFTRMLAERRPL